LVFAWVLRAQENSEVGFYPVATVAIYRHRTATIRVFKVIAYHCKFAGYTTRK